MPFKLPANPLSVWIHTDKHNTHSHTPTHALHNLCERTFRSAFSSIYKWCLWVWTEDGCVRIQFARNAPLYPNHYGNRCECSVAYSHNSIQFDSVRHDSPSVWVDLISISIAILLFSISNQNSQSVSRGRKANPHALYLYCLCVCVCQWQRIEEQKSLKSATGRATRHEDKDECMSAVTGSTSTSASAAAAAFIVVIVGRCFQLKSNKKQPYASTMHHTPVATWA